MKVERINSNQLSIFLNSAYLNDEDISSKDTVIEVVKKWLMHLKKKLHLSGFYKVKVYGHGRVGLFLDLTRLEELEYCSAMDLRVVVFLDEKVYFETVEYDRLPSGVEVYYNSGKYYCNVDYISNLLSVVEYGRFVYGKELQQLYSKWKTL